MAKKVNKSTSLINARFLNAVDVVIVKNSAAGLKPDSERAVSIVISNDPGTISKIQKGKRGATPEQIGKLGNTFNLDFNCIFRNIPVKYEVYNNKVVRSGKTGALASRMIDHFPREVKRMEAAILALNMVIKNLSKEKGDPTTIKQAKKAIEEGKAKLAATFARM